MLPDCFGSTVKQQGMSKHRASEAEGQSTERRSILCSVCISLQVGVPGVSSNKRLSAVLIVQQDRPPAPKSLHIHPGGHGYIQDWLKTSGWVSAIPVQLPAPLQAYVVYAWLSVMAWQMPFGDRFSALSTHVQTEHASCPSQSTG